MDADALTAREVSPGGEHGWKKPTSVVDFFLALRGAAFRPAARRLLPRARNVAVGHDLAAEPRRVISPLHAAPVVLGAEAEEGEEVRRGGGGEEEEEEERRRGGEEEEEEEERRMRRHG